MCSVKNFVARRIMIISMLGAFLLTGTFSYSNNIPVLNKKPRIATLGWESTEMVMILGITPVAVSDINNYNKWVALDPVPKGVVDLGARNAIDLEKLASAKPDLIIINVGQNKYLKKLQTIAPVFVTKMYVKNKSIYQDMWQNFLQIGKVLNRESEARDIMNKVVGKIKKNGQAIGNIKSPVLFTRFLNTGARFRVHGNKSIAGGVMSEMGLNNAYQGAVNHWGFALFTLPKLQNLSADLRFIYIKDDWAGYKELTKNPLWKMFPFVKKKHVYDIESVWTYGGPLSALKISEYIKDALQ